MRQRILVVVCLLVPLMAGGVAKAVAIDWVTVGDAGNAADDTHFGAVAYAYRIGKYEVTNSQYAEFLNAVAATDTNNLYNTNMGSSSHGGIVQSGGSGSFTYSVTPSFSNRPVNYVSFWDSLRFANWLHNGQPTGEQGGGTTEDGAYTITPEGLASESILRNTEATIFIADVDEWYKAAYYDAVSASYFDFPAGTDIPTACDVPGATPNTANCGGAVGSVSDVGAYSNSASPNGTFDQGGNVEEWAESGSVASPRSLGGDWDPRRFGFPPSPLDPGNARLRAGSLAFGSAILESGDLGFRVGSIIPEPSTALLLASGLAGLALSGRRRTPRTQARRA